MTVPAWLVLKKELRLTNSQACVLPCMHSFGFLHRSLIFPVFSLQILVKLQILTFCKGKKGTFYRCCNHVHIVSRHCLNLTVTRSRCNNCL